MDVGGSDEGGIKKVEGVEEDAHLDLSQEFHIWLSCQQFPPSVAKIRHVGIPIFFLLVSLFMIIFGSIWLHHLVPICGTSYKTSSKFRITTSGTKRIMKGIMCPGYDWTRQSTPNQAGAHKIHEEIPLDPQLSSIVTPVGVSTTSGVVGGPIGYALNGVAIFTNADAHHHDAVTAEGGTFDPCAGHNAPNFIWPGYYHYHSLPGDTAPRSHLDVTTVDVLYCNGVQAWYNETSTNSHSPLVGFMVDGIPIYGPRNSSGMVPHDLDECGGHTDLGFYHYHFKTTYPYSVECLRGCIEKKYESNGGHNEGHHSAPVLGSYECSTSGVTQYDYTSLANYDWSYGTGEDSERQLSGPVCLIVFGIVLLFFSLWVMWKLNVVAYCKKSYARCQADTTSVREEMNEDYSAVEVGEVGQDTKITSIIPASSGEKI